jgi:hypothetical protein
MDADQPMEHDHVRQLPHPEAEQRGAEQPPSVRRGEAAAGAPEQPQAERGDRVDRHVEQAVGQDLRPDVAQRLARHEAEEVVPLQHLVQQDAVEEAAEGETEHARGDGRRAAPPSRRVSG